MYIEKFGILVTIFVCLWSPISLIDSVAHQWCSQRIFFKCLFTHVEHFSPQNNPRSWPEWSHSCHILFVPKSCWLNTWMLFWYTRLHSCRIILCYKDHLAAPMLLDTLKPVDRDGSSTDRVRTCGDAPFQSLLNSVSEDVPFHWNSSSTWFVKILQCSHCFIYLWACRCQDLV